MSDHPPAGLIPAVRTRRSLRAFGATPPGDEVLRRLFEAARWAPSGGNGQPWRFVLARAGSEGFERFAATLRPGNAWAKNAPLLVLAAVKTVHDRPDKPVRPNPRALLDLGLAIQNLLLQATAEGLIAHPMAGFEADAAAEAVGLPERHQAVLMIAVGPPGDPAALPPEVRAKDQLPRQRLPVEQFVFEGTFGAPVDLDRGDAGHAGGGGLDPAASRGESGT